MRNRDRAWEALEIQLKAQMVAALDGDREAYSRFLRKVGQIVKSYLLKSAGSWKGSPERVEDLAQEVLLSIHRKRETYDTSLPVLPWVYAIARYRLIDSIRSDSSRKLRTLDWDENIEELASQTAEGSGGGSPHLEVEEELREALDVLSDQQKKILMMAKVEELPLEEIGRQVGMSLSNVKVTIHRTLQALRKRRRL
jgi:RNA polymerase sigma-70 factor (ECF subfamily)